MRRLRQRFYEEKYRELDSETTNIIDHDQLSSHDAIDPAPPIPSVLEQAASIREIGNSSGSAVNGKPR